MPKIGNSIPTVDLPCDRCGSKRKIAKSWTEKIKNDHGTMILEHKDIICTNKECQKAFDETISKEKEKRAKLHQIKLDNDSKRAAEKASRQAAAALNQ